MSLGIPYMGSKRKLSKKIIDHILINNPNCKYIYDLFGGGGAISFQALQRKQIEKVFYNEYNTGVVELLKKIKKDGVTKDFYKWVSRDEFKEKVKNDDWEGGLIKTCWSFGNNQKGYIFSKENEHIKHILHEVVVNDSKFYIDKFKNEYGIYIDTKNITNYSFIDRRLKIMSFIKKQIKERLDMERLQQLERMERLEISNLSYENVNIKTPLSETIIYLDPPYFNTAKYQKSINEEEFVKYVKESKYKIYMSSYELPFNEVASFSHRSNLSASSNNKVIEKLFCNREETFKYQKQLF